MNLSKYIDLSYCVYCGEEFSFEHAECPACGVNNQSNPYLFRDIMIDRRLTDKEMLSEMKLQKRVEYLCPTCFETLNVVTSDDTESVFARWDWDVCPICGEKLGKIISYYYSTCSMVNRRLTDKEVEVERITDRLGVYK